MFSQKGFFKISIKREKYSKEHNRIRIATLYPHTCTSWFDCMIFFSMDPLFDLAKYAMQVCLETFPTWAPHKLFRSRKKKKANSKCLGEETNTWVIWEYRLRSACELYFISKKNGMRWLCFRAVPFLNRPRRYVSHSTYPACMRYVLG